MNYLICIARDFPLEQEFWRFAQDTSSPQRSTSVQGHDPNSVVPLVCVFVLVNGCRRPLIDYRNN